jgi:hypothetical protein
MAPSRSLPVLAVAGATLLLGCSSGPELTAPVETLVELEATWQCEVTRYSFEEAADIETKGEELRGRFGVTVDDHALFATMLDDDTDLRESVALQIDQQCPAGDESGDF